ncbi:MAG: TGS domain-containing protein [Candidatus ainarchaeum sp.]|nr:TGS domain-containing protein [Candidatus ainarchaeum sp.]MDD3976261.1 TGS domain-containing protein [Candidatus ainarchaeum sp.]
MFIYQKEYLKIIQEYTSNIYKAYKISKKIYSSKKIFGINQFRYVLKITEYLTDYDENIIICALLYNPYQYNICLKKENYFPKDIRKICKDYYFFNFIYLISNKDISFDEIKEIIIKSFFKIEAVLVVFAECLAILYFIDKIKINYFKKRFLDVIEFSIIPLTNQLGLYNFKDLLLNKLIYIKSKNKFEETKKYLLDKYPIENLKPFKDIIIDFLKKENLKPIRYSYRYKSVGSFYEKIYLSRKISIDKVFDVYAIRLIYDTKKYCYLVLNKIKKKFKEFPNSKVNDFIKNPKENGYQSIHIRIEINNYPIEIQIRTIEMNNTAEFGIAAHFHYKHISSKIDLKDKKLINFLKNKNNISKRDKNYNDYISVFTPSREKIDIPKKSTILDFAFYLHSDFAKYFSYAIIDSEKIFNKNYLLKNYQTIKIIKSNKFSLCKQDIDNLFVDKNIRELKKLV